jgi:hypothetical protein
MNKNIYEIAQKTALLIKELGEKKLDDGPRENGFWGILCSNLNSKYDLNESKRLKMSFARNNHSYKSLVNEFLDDNKDFCKISYSKSEWQEIMSEHICSDNKRFKQKYAEVLSYKLQDCFGLNCIFQFFYNYFPRSPKVKNNRNYLEKPIWTAELDCIEFSNCKTKLKISAHNRDDIVELKIKMDLDNGKHKDKLIKDLRVSSSDREKEAIILSANGITNTKADNILHNATVSNPCTNI